MTLPTPPPPVPDLREKVAQHLYQIKHLGAWRAESDRVKAHWYGEADVLLSLVRPPSPALPAPDPIVLELPLESVIIRRLTEVDGISREMAQRCADAIFADWMGQDVTPSPAVPDTLTWTREKPKVEGWYWYWANGRWHMMEVRKNFGNGVLHVGRGGPLSDGWNSKWAGPLPEPRDPSQAPTIEGEVK